MRYGITCCKLTRKFVKQRALSNVSFSLPQKGMIGILGHSGSGKTTLLNILAGLDAEYEGEVRVLGANLKKMSLEQRSNFRMKYVGYVFQSFALLEEESALQNVLVPIECNFSCSKERKRKKAADLLHFVDLKGFEGKKVSQLSGGQKQRVAIARALSNDPRIILADEPSGALDDANATLVFSLLRRIAKRALVIVVTHDVTLAKTYFDEAYYLKDGRLYKHVVFKQKEERNAPPSSMALSRKEGRAKPGLGFHLSHAWHLMRAKKYRTLLAEGAISLGLVGVGLSTFLSSTIQEEISSSFSTLMPENALIVSPKSTGTKTIQNVYAAKEEEAEEIMDAYPEYVKGVGGSIAINFEEWFTDANMFTFIYGPNQQVLPGFSARTINDFLWLEDHQDRTYYPEKITSCEGWDEVVIGLPYAAMSNLCYGLHIVRNYESLGEFIAQGKLKIMLSLARYEWEFDDTELFTVIGVTQTEYPCFFHSDHHWNQYFFLDHLRFKSWLSEDTPNPQYALEIPYLSLNCKYEEFVPLLRKKKEYDHLIFECASASLLPSVCAVNEPCMEKRVYLYGADKVGCDWADIDAISQKYPKIIGRTPITQGGFYGDAESIAMGFVGKFFLCESLEKAQSAVDLYSDLPIENADLVMEEIAGTVEGSYLSLANNGLRLSCDLSSPMRGDAPTTLEEVMLSEALYEEFGKPEEIFVAAETFAETIGDTYSRSFGVMSLKVSGVKKGRNRTMYVLSDWAVDFFQFYLGVSSFSLQPLGCVYYLEENEDPLPLQKEILMEFPSYRVGCPKQEMKGSMSTTFSYLGAILGVFSSIALIMSSLLLFVVLSIQASESKKEDSMLLVLGYSKGDIGLGYACQCFAFTLFGILISSIFLVALEVIAKGYIANTFGSSMDGFIDFKPIAVEAIAGFAFALIISLFLYLMLSKKDFRKE